jgi:hypothetical protein
MGLSRRVVPGPERPGFLKDPSRPRWARTPDGRWWSQADIDQAKVIVDEADQVVRLELEAKQRSLHTTPADRAADERSLIDLVLVRKLREVGHRG